MQRYAMRLVAVVLYLGVVAVSAIPVLNCTSDPLPSLASLSLPLCLSSQQCKRRFYLHVGEEMDMPLFSYLIDRLIDETRLNESTVVATLCPETSETSFLWLIFIENYSFCADNELPDMLAGCVCRRDRVCAETPGSELVFGTATFIILLLTFIALILYYGISNARAIAALRDERLSPAHLLAPTAQPKTIGAELRSEASQSRAPLSGPLDGPLELPSIFRARR